jgi:hypothetical protein
VSPSSYANALYEMFCEISGRPKHQVGDSRPWGNVVHGQGTGTAFLPDFNGILLERHDYPPRQWSVRLRGQTGLEVPPGVVEVPGLLPLGVFNVESQISGENRTYRIDAQSNESILSVWGERVRVTCDWDRENITAPHLGPGLIAPASVNFFAGLAEARSVGTARRTLVVDNTAIATTSLSIPAGARGLIFRTVAGFAATLGNLRWLGGISSATNTNIDEVPALAVQAAHDRGDYLSVPSWANRFSIQILALNANLVLAEFEIRP